MRILHVSHRAERLGGAESHLHALIEGQRERGHRTYLVAGHASERGERADCALVKRPEFDPAALLEDPEFTDAFERAAHLLAPDVVHFHQTLHLPVSVYRSARALGVPVVQSLYDHGLLCPSGWMVTGDGRRCGGGPGAQCFRQACERHQSFDAAQVAAGAWRLRVARTALDAVIAGTDQLAGLARDHGLPCVRVIPYFPPRPLAEGDVARSPDRIVCVARLEAEKGVDVLLEAFARLAERRPGARLTLVGSGSRRGALEAKAGELGIWERVEFAGELDLAGVGEAIAGAAVLAVPSVWAETMPLVVLDAFATGTPIVATDVGGIPFAIRDGESGLLVPPRDAAALASSLERVLGDRALAARLASGGRTSLARFDRRAHLDATDALYAELRGTESTARRTDEPAAADPGEEWAIACALVRANADHEAKHLELLADAARERAWIRQTLEYVTRDPVTRTVNRLRGGPDLSRLIDDLVD